MRPAVRRSLRRRSPLGLALVAVAALVVAGCGSAPPGSPKSGASSTAASATAASAAAGSAPAASARAASSAAASANSTPTATAASPSFAPSPSASPGDRAFTEVVGPADLPSVLAAIRAGDAPFRDIVTSVGIDGTHPPAPLVRECAYFVQCRVIGTLDGLADPAGTVAIDQQEYNPDLPPATTPADLAGPVALRVRRAGPIAFLGHVRLGASGLVASVADAGARTASAPNSETIVVDGWLTDVQTSCGPAPIPLQPPVPAPFDCHPPGAVWESEDLSGASVDVQTHAYQQFARDPTLIGSAPPRFGTYVLRMVVYEAVNCHACRGWLMVGRLDAAVRFPREPTDVPVTRTAEELAAILARDRASLVGQFVFVDGQILPGRPTGGCADGPTCPIGLLQGSNEPVVATPYTVSLLLPDTDFPTHGQLVFVVRPDGLEYVGFFGIANGGTGSAIFSVGDLRDPNNRGPLVVLAKGWLVSVTYACPTSMGPPDTPFEGCPSAWLTPESEPGATPVGSSVNSFTFPTDGILVQPGAYARFAPDPQILEGTGAVPRIGTYLLREVTDVPDQPASRRGWQIVGRFAP